MSDFAKIQNVNLLRLNSTPVTPSTPKIRTEDWGEVPYLDALKRQEELVERIYREGLPGVLVFCTHPPVVTLGRRTQPEDVTSWGGEIVAISRGGRATYHGPNQIVIYPIFNLGLDLGLGFASKDINAWLRYLESTLIQLLSEIGILEAEPSVGEAGVWLKVANRRRKIASIGIGVRHWVSFHGASLNVEGDSSLYQGLKPCGYTADTPISLRQLQGAKTPDSSILKAKLQKILLREK